MPHTLAVHYCCQRSSYGTTGVGDTSRVGQLRGQVDEVKGMVVDNIDKINKRGENLDNLDERTSKYLLP